MKALFLCLLGAVLLSACHKSSLDPASHHPQDSIPHNSAARACQIVEIVDSSRGGRYAFVYAASGALDRVHYFEGTTWKAGDGFAYGSGGRTEAMLASEAGYLDTTHYFPDMRWYKARSHYANGLLTLQTVYRQSGALPPLYFVDYWDTTTIAYDADGIPTRVQTASWAHPSNGPVSVTRTSVAHTLVEGLITQTVATTTRPDGTIAEIKTNYAYGTGGYVKLNPVVAALAEQNGGQSDYTSTPFPVLKAFYYPAHTGHKVPAQAQITFSENGSEWGSDSYRIEARVNADSLVDRLKLTAGASGNVQLYTFSYVCE